MLHRYLISGRLNLHLIWLTLALILLPVAHSQMPINISTSLNSFEHDLEAAHLKLERLSANWQLITADSSLKVQMLKAERLIITLKPTAGTSASPGLPEKISLPLPISIRQAEVQEILIVSGDSEQRLKNVRFNLDADSREISINLAEAVTPWGNASAHVRMAATKPFALQGDVQLIQPEPVRWKDSHIAYHLKSTLKGSLEQIEFSSAHTLLKTTEGFHLKPVTDSVHHAAAIADNISINSTISINGTIGLSQEQAVRIDMHATGLQPEQFGDYPQGKLNIEANLKGKLQPQPEISVQARALDSLWNKQPFTLEASMQWLHEKITALSLESTLGQNRLTASGSFGSKAGNIETSSIETGSIEWHASLPELNQLHSALNGNAKADGKISGSFDQPIASLSIKGHGIGYENKFSLADLTAEASLNAGNKNAIAASITATDAVMANQDAMNIQAVLSGTFSQHQLAVSASNPKRQLAAALHGGIQTNDQQQSYWQGNLQSFAYTATSTIQLKNPASLLISSDSTRLGKTVLTLPSGEIDIGFVEFGESGFNSEGAIRGLRLTELPAELLILPDSVLSSPVFSGQWQISAQDSMNARLHLLRDSGDFLIQQSGAEPVTLGLSEAKLQLDIISNRIQLGLNIHGEKLGHANVKLNTAISKTENGYALLANTPLQLDANAVLSSLAWIPLSATAADIDLDGKISLNMRADGTLASPGLQGQLTGQDLVLTMTSAGVALKNGNIDAAFSGNALQINRFIWHGESGNISATGLISMQDGKPSMALDWNADQFTAISRTDRLLIVNGQARTEVQDDLMKLSGKVAVSKGLFEIAGENAPSLGEDVVVLGRGQESTQSTMKILLNGLTINLGQDFTLRGLGLDAQLAGEVRLTGLTQYQPHTEGSIQVKKGTFMAYGQLLNIERGILNFNGPAENPGLNIRAMRNTKPVNAGVEITGTAFAPVSKLVSIPNVSDTEKLSWLVLGQGLDKAGKSEYAMLSLAAGALFSKNESVPLQTKIARFAGLDELNFAGNDAQSAAVSFGKRLSSDLYLSYEKSISGLADMARLTYYITPAWSVRGASGAESAVDVLYTFSFK